MTHCLVPAPEYNQCYDVLIRAYNRALSGFKNLGDPERFSVRTPPLKPFCSEMSGRKQSQRPAPRSAPQLPQHQEQQSESSSSSLNVRFSQDSVPDVEQQQQEQLRAGSAPPTARRQVFFPSTSTSSTALGGQPSQHSPTQTSTTSTDTVSVR